MYPISRLGTLVKCYPLQLCSLCMYMCSSFLRIKLFVTAALVTVIMVQNGLIVQVTVMVYSLPHVLCSFPGTEGGTTIGSEV